MCQYCGIKEPKERKMLIDDAEYLAGQFQRLSNYYLVAAHGQVKHHVEGSEAQKVSSTARSVVRRLVEDFV